MELSSVIHSKETETWPKKVIESSHKPIEALKRIVKKNFELTSEDTKNLFEQIKNEKLLIE